MQGRMKTRAFVLMIGIILLCGTKSVSAYTGSGTKSNPYVVTAESGLREILTSKGSNNWVYVGIDNDITIKKNIYVKSGKFRLFAKSRSRYIKRSGSVTDNINSGEYPNYCINMVGNANIEFGCDAMGTNILKLGGNKSKFVDNEKSAGWLYMASGTKAVLDKDCLMTNVLNNKSEQGGSAICSYGSLTINGGITNCEGSDGGAIGIQKGKLTINSGAYIRNCVSKTEGGAVFAHKNSSVIINGGEISGCISQEEGGGLFVSESTCVIKDGVIKDNYAGTSGGGIFSGFGTTLTIGSKGKGPTISGNRAMTIGGGLRCNGGQGDNAGGITYLYGGTITNNYAAENSGGVSCGKSSINCKSKIALKNITISNNCSIAGSGGIRFPKTAMGTGGSEIEMSECRIYGNETKANGAGIMCYCSLKVINSSIKNNYAVGNGGGIYINNGIVNVQNSTVENNRADKKGSGVYVDGEFKIGGSTFSGESNEVYLTKGTYIDVVNQLSKTSGLVSLINSEVNNNGTRLIKASYTGGTGKGELLRSNGSEKYSCNSIRKSQFLRSSEKVSDYGNQWIIISEKYTISYDKNTLEQVANLPEDTIKYWGEDAYISSNIISRKGYILVDKKHWNISSDGNGKQYIKGEKVTENKNINLYAIWEKIKISKLYIWTVDRYFIVNQHILLDKKELLKKVTVKDDLNTGAKYNVSIVSISDVEENSIVAKGSDLQSEKYINTENKKVYKLEIKTVDEETKVEKTATMYVYISDVDLVNNQVRFISYEYLKTLDITSKWNRRLKNNLLESLRKSNDKKGIYTIDISKEDIKEIKENVKNNGYVIDKKSNESVIARVSI